MREVPRPRPLALKLAASLAALAIACGGPPALPAPPAASPPAPIDEPPPSQPLIEAPKSPFSEWEKTDFGAVMVHEDLPEAFDLLVHFHVGKPAAEDYRTSGLRAVVVGLDHGLFAKQYSQAYDDKTRFPKVLEAVVAHVRERTGRAAIHPGRIALVAWSAGYGAVRKVLAQQAEAIDAVILLDGLHTAYRHGWRSKRVDLKDLDPFLRFARQAADGKKLMVLTHSAIVPGDYASTTETTSTLIAKVGAARVTTELEPSAGLTPTSRADKGDFHVRAFEGETKEAHVAQLHLVRLALAEYLLPRWR